MSLDQTSINLLTKPEDIDPLDYEEAQEFVRARLDVMQWRGLPNDPEKLIKLVMDLGVEWYMARFMKRAILEIMAEDARPGCSEASEAEEQPTQRRM